MVTAMTAGHVISTEKISAGEDALQFLSDSFKLPVDKFPLKSPSALKIHFASTEAKVAALCREKASLIFILTNIICNNIIKK